MKLKNNNVTFNINDKNSFLYKEFFDKSFSIMLLIDFNTSKIVEANHAACKFYGYSHNEITHLKITDINILSDNEINEEIKNAKNTNRDFFNFKHKLANNELRDVEVYSNLIIFEGQKILFSVIHDITEKNILSKKTQEDEIKFNSVFDLYAYPAHMVNNEFDIISVNKEFLKLKGLEKKNIIGKKCYNILQNKKQICENCNVNNLFNNKKVDPVKQTLKYVDGKHRIYITNVYPIKNNNNEITHAVEVTKDITERENLVNELKQNKKLLEIAQEIAHVGHWQYNIKEKKLIWSDEIYRIFNLKPQSKVITYTDFIKYIHPDDRNKVDLAYTSSLKNKTDYKVEHKLLLNNGKIKHVIEKCKTIYDTQNNPIESIGTIQDITENKQNELLLEMSEQKYKHLTESITDCIFTIDLKGKITYINKAFENLIKYNANDFIGTHFLNQICPEYKKIIAENFKIGINGHKTYLREIEIFDKNNNRIPIEIKAFSLLDNNKKTIGRIGVLREITERKLVEKEKRKNEESFKSLVYDAADIIVIIDKKGIIKYLNKIAEKLTGYTAKEVINTSFTNYIPKKDNSKVFNHLEKIFINNEVVAFESVLISKNGNETPFISTIKSFKYNDETSNMVIIKDITKIKETELALKESRELYQSIFEASGTAMLMMNENFEIEMANKEFFNLIGITNNALPKTWRERIPKKSIAILEKKHTLRRKDNKNVPEKYTVKLQHHDGSMKDVVVNAVMLPDSKKSIISMLDITEQNIALKKLEESEKKFREMNDLLPQSIYEADLEGNITYANKFAINLFGYTQKEINNGLDFAQMLSHENRFEAKQNYKALILGKKINTHEYTARKKDGATFPIVLSSAPIIKQGEIVGIRGAMTDLTTQKKAEENIIKFNAISNQAVEGITIADNKGKYTYVNPAFCKMTGYSEKELLKMTVFNILHQEKECDDFFECVRKQNTMAEFDLKRKNNSVFSTEIISKIITIGNHKFVLGTIRDITESKKNKIILKESEKRYKDLFYKSKDPILILYKNKIIDCNIATANILETSSINHIIGRKPFELSPKYQENGEISENKSQKEIEKAYNEGYNRFEWEHITFKGNKVYVEISLTPITIDNKEMIYVVWRNISKRKKNEKEINKLSIAVKQSPSVVVITDIEGNIEYINPAFTRITDYSQEEAIGQNSRILASGETTTKEYKELWDTIKSGNIWRGELHNKKKDNTLYWEKIVISPVKNNKGEIINFIAIKTDITKQKEARDKLININSKFKKQNIEIKLQNKLLVSSEKELLAINKEFNAVINTSKAIFIEVDSNYKVIRWNKSAVKVTGILSAKIINRSIKELNLDSDINNLIIEIIENGLKGIAVKEKEITFNSTKREIQTILISSDAKLDNNNNIKGVFIVAQDITTITNYNKFLELQVEDRTLELKEALHKEKELSELKSKFVSVVSHEFRTPLSAINFSANFINNYFDKLKKEKIKIKLKNIETQVKHMTMLLDDVLIMGKIQSNRVVFNPEIITAEEYFKPIIEEVYISKNKTHTIIYSENVENAKICVDKAQARNIFINLLSNAIKFSPNSTEVYLKVEMFNKNTRITVTDTGIGLDDTSEIFKPFVRGVNAENIQGTGLGLSIVKEAVKKHKGKINVNSKINEGTSIEIVLPNNQEIKN